MSESGHGIERRLNELLVSAGQNSLIAEQAEHFQVYLSLIVRWNARMNLTAVRDEEGILSRHFVESIAFARALPAGIGTLLDFGSGAGFPGVPIAICRPEVSVTLAESQGKKAAFLQEVVRTLGLKVQVHAGRAEELQAGFDCVVMRAVDRMEKAVEVGAALVRPDGWLGLLTTQREFPVLEKAAGEGFAWGEALATPGGEDRVAVFGRRDR